jgi:hypothetical protein
MSQSTGQFEAPELIPNYWRGITVKTMDDIVFLGKGTIRQILRHWRHIAEEQSFQITKLNTELSFLRGKTAKDIAIEAKKFENPHFIPEQIGIAPSDYKDPEPLDDASRQRKSGATTFNVCGWCQYATSGRARYNYLITTNCNLLTDAGFNDSGEPIPYHELRLYGERLAHSWKATGNELENDLAFLKKMDALIPGIREVVTTTDFQAETERRFYTPCFLPYLNDEKLRTIRIGLSDTLDSLVKEKRATDDKIKLLLSLEKKAEEKPILFHHRPYNWFNVDDSIVCYAAIWKDRLVPDVWIQGKVVPGYRHHDGAVSVCLDKKIHTNETNYNGHGVGFGMSRPEVMHTWEYEYLRSHVDFAKLWLNSYTDLDNYDPEQMFQDLTKEAL